LHGRMAPMAKICQWAKTRDLRVIEDACQVHGATVDGRPAGSWGDVSVLSFGGSKMLAAGRGGAVLTNSSRLAQRMTVFCERGNDAYAMSELQSAALIPQLERLEIDHRLRLQAANALLQETSKYTWLTPIANANADEPAFYKVGFLLDVSVLESASVQQFVQRLPVVDEVTRPSVQDSLSSPLQTDGRVESAARLTVARAWVLSEFDRLGIQMGAGFKGFMRRSDSRCRKPVALTESQRAAEATMVLHHVHLLDPQTGFNTIDLVVEAFQIIDREIVR
jgi:perosamine synthetase